MITYIVYKQDYTIVKTFPYFGGDLVKTLDEDETYRWVNDINPAYKGIIAKINKVNLTNY